MQQQYVFGTWHQIQMVDLEWLIQVELQGWGPVHVHQDVLGYPPAVAMSPC